MPSFSVIKKNYITAPCLVKVDIDRKSHYMAFLDKETDTATRKIGVLEIPTALSVAGI